MNTKNLDRAERRERKRQARRALKALYASMSPAERSKLEQARESKPNTGMKKFVTELRKGAAKS
jgi:hypothetical protein